MARNENTRKRLEVAPALLKVGAPRADWAVDFSPDQRSAHVRAVSCADHLESFSTISPEGN